MTRYSYFTDFIVPRIYDLFSNTKPFCHNLPMKLCIVVGDYFINDKILEWDGEQELYVIGTNT